MKKLVFKTAAVGALGGAVFVFLFPRGAITTLMHQVLRLPGPGAGIALVLGPFLLVLALVAYRWAGDRPGGSLVLALSFSVVAALLAALVSAMNPKGMFSTIWFVLACMVCGLGVEAMLVLVRKLGPLWRLLLAGVAGNLLLLIFYWLAIFPMAAGWVEWGDVPVLLAVCVAGGLLAGLIAWLVSRAILNYIGSREEDDDNVRTR
jgi:hypothetical protein